MNCFLLACVLIHTKPVRMRTSAGTRAGATANGYLDDAPADQIRSLRGFHGVRYEPSTIAGQARHPHVRGGTVGSMNVERVWSTALTENDDVGLASLFDSEYLEGSTIDLRGLPW